MEWHHQIVVIFQIEMQEGRRFSPSDGQLLGDVVKNEARRVPQGLSVRMEAWHPHILQSRAWQSRLGHLIIRQQLFQQAHIQICFCSLASALASALASLASFTSLRKEKTNLS